MAGDLDATRDDDLAARARSGSAEAMEELYRRHRTRIFGYALRVTGDHATAEDVFQNTFIYFFQHLDRYQPQGKLAAYLFRIAHSLATDEKAAARRLKPLGDRVDPAFVPDAVPDDSQARLRDRLQECLLALPVHLREVVALRLHEGLDYARIGEITGVSEATARSRMRYALDALRVALEGEMPSE